MTDTITVVSGLPRSGTSMMMSMLADGGLPVLTDGQRTQDSNNPRGYFEYAPVKRLRQDTSWVPLARGKAIKVVSPLLSALPLIYQYTILFMERDLDAVLASQRAMLTQQEDTEDLVSSRLPPEQRNQEDARLKAVYARHLLETRNWLNTHTLTVLRVSYTSVLKNPQQAAREIIDFLDVPLDMQAMAAAVAPELCHHGNQSGPISRTAPS